MGGIPPDEDDKDHVEGWLLNVIGKGGRLRQVPVPLEVISELSDYLQSRGPGSGLRDAANIGAFLFGKATEMAELEAALATLAGAGAQGWNAIHQSAGAILCVGSRKVQLGAGLSDAEIAAAIDAAVAARIVDQRAPNRRRHDLSGLRCDLSH